MVGNWKTLGRQSFRSYVKLQCIYHFFATRKNSLPILLHVATYFFLCISVMPNVGRTPSASICAVRATMAPTSIGRAKGCAETWRSRLRRLLRRRVSALGASQIRERSQLVKKSTRMMGGRSEPTMSPQNNEK